MTTTAPADARLDLLANPLFLAACSAWQRDGRAFVGFADVLLGWGMEAEAAAWVWAATEPDRNGDEDGAFAGPFRPYHYPEGKCYWWIDGKCQRGWYNVWPDGITGENKRLDSFPAAILWFLNRSAEVYGAAGPPRTEVPEVAGV